MVISMVTTYLVIKDVIHNIKGFHATISAHFKQEMFQSRAIDQNRIKHYLLPGLSNFVVNRFCFKTAEFLHSHSHDHYYNLSISKGVNIPRWQMKVLQSFHSAHQIPYVVQLETYSLRCEVFCLFVL